MFLSIKRGKLYCFNGNSYLETNHWKGILTRKIMMLAKGFFDIPGQNGGLPNFTSGRADEHIRSIKGQ